MQGKALVEDYKLSDEHKAFLKKFQQLKQVRDVLGGRAEMLKQEMQKISGLFILLDQSAQELGVPKSILKGFADQDFESMEQPAEQPTLEDAMFS
jgi:hypothetical protein